MKKPKFGPAGSGDLFYSKGYKTSSQVPLFLSEAGLSAFEYQCGRGVNIGTEKANLLGEEAKKYNIALSVHAPYFISLSTDDPEKTNNNLRYFSESARAASDMGATRVIFHPGGLFKLTREEAWNRASKCLEFILKELEPVYSGNISFCPETMGKLNQLGDLDETLKFCSSHDRLIPCIDFGHLNSRTQGEIKAYKDFEKIFDTAENAIGKEKTKIIHCHFSKIEYSAGGEKKHLTFEDEQFGPDYKPLMELINDKGYTPTIICESAGTQAEDAKAMSDYYNYLK